MRRRLELPAERNAILGKLLRKLDERGCPYVLVGGLVPTLLREVLDPEPLDEPSESRSTVDCDLALDVAVSAADEWQRMQGILRDEGFGRFEKESQFCWSHPCGLMIDPMPVPAGIERGEPAAVSFARTFVERDTSKFFRGYELALQRPLIVEITFDGSDSYPLRIAGLPAMLAMKLQAWTDRRATEGCPGHRMASSISADAGRGGPAACRPGDLARTRCRDHQSAHYALCR